MKTINQWAFAVASAGSLVGCAPPSTELSAMGPVTVIQQIEVQDKQGNISIIAERLNELAERSTADKGAESLLAAQRVATIDNFFSHYDVGVNDEIVASVFNQENIQGSDIWVYSSGRTRITNTTYFNNGPSFSSDGRFIYFVSTRGKNISSLYDQNSYIWRMSSRGGGGITRIGSPVYRYESPRVSPDGRYMLYSAQEFSGNSRFIWYSDINGALPTQLTKGVHAAWMNSSIITFAVEDESTGLYTIWTHNIDGGELTQIITDPKLDCFSPAPQPGGGSYIAYVKQEPEEGPGRSRTRDIYVYNNETGLSQQLTTNLSRDDMPRWSNDGKSLYFRSSRGIQWSIWRIPAQYIN